MKETCLLIRLAFTATVSTFVSINTIFIVRVGIKANQIQGN